VKTRFGIAYDKTPVKQPVDRTMTLPDSDRTWLSFGVKYSLSKISSIDVGYSHIFFANASTARAVTTGYPGTQTLRQTIRGSFDTTADILSMQYNHTF
jgi:long-chain fatty acid transport protein